MTQKNGMGGQDQARVQL